MKKKGKLQIKKVTLRDLDDPTISRVAGAEPVWTADPTCNTDCPDNCTDACTGQSTCTQDSNPQVCGSAETCGCQTGLPCTGQGTCNNTWCDQNTCADTCVGGVCHIETWTC